MSNNRSPLGLFLVVANLSLSLVLILFFLSRVLGTSSYETPSKLGQGIDINDYIGLGLDSLENDTHLIGALLFIGDMDAVNGLNLIKSIDNVLASEHANQRVEKVPVLLVGGVTGASFLMPETKVIKLSTISTEQHNPQRDMRCYQGVVMFEIKTGYIRQTFPFILSPYSFVDELLAITPLSAAEA